MYACVYVCMRMYVCMYVCMIPNFRRFLKMYTFLAKLSREDNRSILATNTSFICRKMNVCKNMLLNNKNIIYEKYMYNVNENEECMRTAHMIKELNEGVEGFSKDEICDILNYITTLYNLILYPS